MHNLDLELSNFPLTDAGNVERLRRRFGDEICFVKEYGGWLLQTGAGWRMYEITAVQLRAQKVARLIDAEADAALAAGPIACASGSTWKSESETEFRRRIKAIRAWSVRSGNTPRLRAVVRLAATVCPRKGEEIQVENPRLLRCHLGLR